MKPGLHDYGPLQRLLMRRSRAAQFVYEMGKEASRWAVKTEGARLNVYNHKTELKGQNSLYQYFLSQCYSVSLSCQ